MLLTGSGSLFEISMPVIVVYYALTNMLRTIPSAPAVKQPTATKGQETISPLVKLQKEDTLRVDAVHDVQVPRRP